MTLHTFVALSLFLFSLGLYAVLARQNLIAVLIGIELMLNAAALNFLAFGYFTSPDPALGQLVVLFVIGLAAAEVAIFLSIVLAVYRSRKSIDVERLNELQG
jgi:NADH:ubiquinone oxidoreductase subunit K